MVLVKLHAVALLALAACAGAPVGETRDLEDCTIDRWLRATAGDQAIDCGHTIKAPIWKLTPEEEAENDRRMTATVECMDNALSKGQPFFGWLQTPGIDSVIAEGFAYDGSTIWFLDSDSFGPTQTTLYQRRCENTSQVDGAWLGCSETDYDRHTICTIDQPPRR